MFKIKQMLQYIIHQIFVHKGFKVLGLIALASIEFKWCGKPFIKENSHLHKF
jgi:hypothetical protein